MATIILQRSNEYANRIRDYQVYVDGAKLGVIANGATKEFEVLPGRHTLQCRIDWCSSPTVEFDMSVDTIKIFEVSGFKNSKWVMRVGIGIVLLSFIVEWTVDNPIYIFAMLLPVFLVLMYFITFGRKRYLTLREV